jgi:hypothetical protein
MCSVGEEGVQFAVRFVQRFLGQEVATRLRHSELQHWHIMQ